MSVFILIVISGLYALLILFFSVGILKTKKRSVVKTSPLSVSVVVPMRNEEEFLPRTLKALAEQDFEGDWEVILVNDRSTDATPEIIEDFCKKNNLFRCLHLDHSLPDVEGPKKRALEFGFKEAKYEVLLIMDADCMPSKTWVSSMLDCFDENIQIVQGAKKNTGTASILHRVQQLETLGFTAIEAAGYTLGVPMLASAASLAYRKDLFFKVNGFEDLMGYSSGDDDMLIHKMIQEEGVGYCYNLDPNAIMKTAPVDSWKALFYQRARWSSNGAKYQNPFYVLLLSLIYSFFVWLFISPWLALFFKFPWQWFWAPFLMKCMLDFIFLGIAAFKLEQKKLLFSLPLVEFIQVPMIVLSVPFGWLGLFKWK